MSVSVLLFFCTCINERPVNLLQRSKESKSKERKSNLRSGKNKAGVAENSESLKSSGIQLSITEFYRSTKALGQAKTVEDPEKNLNIEEPPRENRKMSADLDPNLPKSVRRRLLFD